MFAAAGCTVRSVRISHEVKGRDLDILPGEMATLLGRSEIIGGRMETVGTVPSSLALSSLKVRQMVPVLSPSSENMSRWPSKRAVSHWLAQIIAVLTTEPIARVFSNEDHALDSLY